LQLGVVPATNQPQEAPSSQHAFLGQTLAMMTKLTSRQDLVKSYWLPALQLLQPVAIYPACQQAFNMTSQASWQVSYKH